MTPLALDGVRLTRGDVVDVACHGRSISFTEAALERVDRAANYVADKARHLQVVYGVTTGFGKNSDVMLAGTDSAESLQRNLIISHAVCVGNPLSKEATRAILVIRINTLLKGHSGMRRSTIELLAEMLNRGVHPIIPEKGSVGASGDLAPLSHVGLVLIGLGEAEWQGERLPGAEALRRAGLFPIDLTYKEGLALNNTTAFMAGLGVLALDRVRHAVRTADLAAALCLEAIAGRSAALDEDVHRLRPHPGQIAVADNLRRLTAGSRLIDIDPECVPRLGGSWIWDEVRERLVGGKSLSPQDSYSLRCVPQVHGAVRDVLSYAEEVVDRELSAVTDNPILFPEEDKVISAGNFHGMPIALALAAVKNAVPVLGSISERRLNKLVDAATSDGLPFFLVKNDDSIQSGHMIIQYTAASLVNELATRSHSATVYSIPTCANVEDHVSMGANEARHLLEMVTDLEQILALEILTGAQALEVRLRILHGEYWPEPVEPRSQARHRANRTEKHQPSPAISEVFSRIRGEVAYLAQDRELRHDIDAITRLTRGPDLLRSAEAHAGALH